MPTKKELELQIENLQKELNLYKNKPQLGRSYSNCLRENKQLKEENEKLKEISDELKEDIEDYKLFCDAFDVPCAMEAIHNHWRNLPDESKEELTQKGLNPK
jgi:regulator of replication initiation timing